MVYMNNVPTMKSIRSTGSNNSYSQGARQFGLFIIPGEQLYCGSTTIPRLSAWCIGWSKALVDGHLWLTVAVVVDSGCTYMTSNQRKSMDRLLRQLKTATMRFSRVLNTTVPNRRWKCYNHTATCYSPQSGDYWTSYGVQA